MLNTLIHNPNIKPSDRISFSKFLLQTKGIDNGCDVDRDYLYSVYERVRSNEFKANEDHVNIVLDFERNLVGLKKPMPTFQLAQPHRRLICYVQLYEINDLAKKEKLNTHQRDIFLFNDLLVVRSTSVFFLWKKYFSMSDFQVTKILSKKKSNILYTHRSTIPLESMDVFEFRTDRK
jgi:hypothetical protein